MKPLVFPRQTLKNSVSFCGKGVHTGAAVKAAVHPGKDGIIFRHGKNHWKACPENVTRTELCTCLGEISTIEHLMSAFAGLGITDAEVELTGLELPAMDGASLAFCQELQVTAGFEEIGTERLMFPSEEVFVEDSLTRISVKGGEGNIQYTFESGERWPKSQTYRFRFDSAKSYMKEIALARTFCFEEQVPQILSAGLGQGLDETTALIIGEHGYVNQEKFPDEPARHKILDLMGDLYLAGVPLQFLDIKAKRGGHALNVRMAAEILRHVKKES